MVSRMKLMNSDDVIKIIDKHTFETKDGLCLDDDITCILEEVPTFEPEDRCGECDAWNQYKNYSQKSQWIPCSERLPEYWKSVLVCFKPGRKCPHDQIQVGCFGTHEVEDEWFEKIGNVIVLYTSKYYYPLDEVAAWMPRPKPYTEKEN